MVLIGLIFFIIVFLCADENDKRKKKQHIQWLEDTGQRKNYPKFHTFDQIETRFGQVRYRGEDPELEMELAEKYYNELRAEWNELKVKIGKECGEWTEENADSPMWQDYPASDDTYQTYSSAVACCRLYNDRWLKGIVGNGKYPPGDHGYYCGTGEYKRGCTGIPTTPTHRWVIEYSVVRARQDLIAMGKVPSGQNTHNIRNVCRNVKILSDIRYLEDNYWAEHYLPNVPTDMAFI